MRLLSVCSCGFNLGRPLVGFFNNAEQLFRNAVGESGQSSRYCLSLFTIDGKVDDIVVNGVIANESAGMCKPRHFWRQIERIDFVRESSPVGFSGIHHALYTDPKHGAGCARRQIDDLLRFFKDFLGVARHAGSSRNSTSYWEDEFVMFEKNNPPASATHRNVVHAITEKSKGLINCYFLQLSSSTWVLINECRRTGSKGLDNW